MPRISKAAANLAVDRVVADVQTHATIISTVEQQAIDQYNGWAAHRGTTADGNAAYAKQHLLEKYDANNNGYSASEIAKMSKLGRAFIALAVEMKSTKLADLAAQCDFMSETDATPTVVTSSSSDPMAAFPDVLHDTFGPDLTGLVADSSGDVASFLANQATPSDPSDDFSVKNAAAWSKLADGLRSQLSDLRLVKVGPSDGNGGLAQDHGAYEYFVLGTTKDGKTAGVAFKSVET